MRSKKNKETKKYALGGVVAGLAGLGQAGLGAYQMYQGQQMAKDIKEASTARPSEYADMLKLARQADLEQRRLEELNRTLATGIGAAQQAGGRAVVGALPAMVRAGDVGAQNILAQRQAAQMAALQQAAGGAEREISREMAREQQQRAAAQAAVEGGLQNIAGAVGGIGKAAVLGAFGDGTKKGSTAPAAATTGLSEESMAIVSPAQSIERMAGEQAVTREAQRASLLQQERPMASFADLKPMPTDQELIVSPAQSIERMAGERAVTREAQRSSLLRPQRLAPVLAEEMISPYGQYLTDQAAINQMLTNRTSYLKDGGMMTGGKFSHKTNPIDIVQKGKKIGEMTGGEVILNPAQQKKLSQESAYFRSLLKKFNKKK